MRLHILVPIALILSTSLWFGCASRPEPAPPLADITIPKSWASAETGSSGAPTAWLAQFNSDSLHILIETALENNPNFKIAAARLSQAEAEARIAGADRLPTANLGLNAARQRISTFGPQSTGGVRFENYDLALNLSWEVDLWGRLKNQSEAALAELQASAAELEAARLSLCAQVTKAWLQCIAAQTQLELAETNAQTYQNNLESLENRFRNGLTTGLELRLQRRQTATAQAEVSQYRRQVDQSTKALEILTGRYPQGTLKGYTTHLPALPDRLPAGLPADLLERRPDLIAAERNLAAAEKSLSASRKSRLPQISLTASGGTSSQEFDNLLDGDFSVWSLAGNLTQPIFQAGRIRANIDRSASLRDQALANYVDTALQAFYEVETTLAAENFLRQQVLELSTAAQEATEAQSLAQERYSNGTAEFTDYLNTQRDAANIQSQLVSTQRLLLENRIDLYLALGGPVISQP